MKISPSEYKRLTGKEVLPPLTDADRVVQAIAGLADALSKQAERPAATPVIEVNLPPAKVAAPVVEVTVPPANVTVQDIQPEPRRPWEFTVNDANGNLKYTIIAKPK